MLSDRIFLLLERSFCLPLAGTELADCELDRPELLGWALCASAAGRNRLIVLLFGNLLEYRPDQVEPAVPNDRKEMLGCYVEVERLPRTPGSRAGRHLRAGAVVPLRRRRSTSDRKSTRLNSSHQIISYAVFCLKKKKNITIS